MRKASMIAFAVLFLLGCNRYPAENLSNGALDLKLTYGDWVGRGRPKDYNVASFIQPNGTNLTLFSFTNSVTHFGKTYQCRFGAHDTSWPTGTLAISEDGTVLWIRERDQKVTLSPERSGVAP